MLWVVDIREPEEMVKYFTSNHNAKVDKLEVGDYVAGEMVGFERKSSDFLDFQRMLSQVDELVGAYPYPFLVVEKSLTDIIMESQKIFHKNLIGNILGVVASLSVRGCPPIFCGNQVMMIQIMEKLAEKSLDGKNREIKRILRTKHYDSEDISINILRGFGLGISRAEDISNKYNGDVRTILDVLMNHPEELKEICGISNGTIEKIKANVNAKRIGGKVDDGEAADGKIETEMPF